uniref:Caprin-1 dimerization domain-containing protein n=1 Tax=Setaria digitata TaxID=48799 RepID=A0A915PFL6_9BILA
MQEQSDDEILNEWNPGTDMIVTLLSDKIKHLQEQENLERERMDVTAGNINQNQLQTDNCNLTMTMCQVDVLRDVLNTYLSEMAERSQASTEQRKKKRLTLIEQVAVFLQYKKIIAMTQIPEINLSFGSGTNGATKLNGQELMLLNSVNAVVNPVINFTENEQVRLRRLQASVEHGMRIVNDSRMRVISQHTGHDIKRLLDRVSNCDLLGKMPFWLENMNFIREMPFPPPARAVRCSASSFAIGGRTPDCSFDDQNSIYPGAKRTSLGQIKTTKQRFQYSVEPKSNGGLTENDELKMKTVDGKDDCCNATESQV